MSDIQEKSQEDIDFDLWINCQVGLMCMDKGILQFDSYSRILRARLREAFISGVLSERSR